METISIELITVALVALLVGVFIGIGVARVILKGNLEGKFEKAKKEHQDEREELSLEVADQLAQIRNSIVQTATSYQVAVKSLEKKLAISPESLEKAGMTSRLSLELKGEDTKIIEHPVKKPEEGGVEEDDIGTIPKASAELSGMSAEKSEI